MMSLLVAASAAAATPGVVRQPYGTTRGGDAVERIVLTGKSGMRVGILTLGGIIDEIAVPDRAGRRANVVLALPDLAAYEAKPNFGSLVGRYAGRISHGGFTIDGIRYPLSNDPQAIVSHGGAPNFAARIWRAELCETPGCTAITLHYTSPDGDNGFPGRLDVAVTYSLDADNTLRLDYVATANRPTVLNLTHHAYFNLAGGMSGSTDDQRLQIHAARIAELDAKRIPTGAFLPVDGTPFDFRTAARIGDRVGSNHPLMLLARGLDHGFAIDGSGLRLAACAFDPASGRTLELRTTEPSLQVYTANSFDGTLVGAGGRTIRQGDGYALETQHFPDSPNRPEFPSTLLRPGETFRSTTSFRFGVERKANAAGCD